MARLPSSPLLLLVAVLLGSFHVHPTASVRLHPHSTQGSTQERSGRSSSAVQSGPSETANTTLPATNTTDLGNDSTNSTNSTGSTDFTGLTNPEGSTNSTGSANGASAPTKANSTLAANVLPPGFRYRGGPILTEPISVNLIWLGNFSEAQKELVRTFLRSLSTEDDSPGTVAGWWGVTTRYTDGKGRPVSKQVSLGGEYSMATAQQLVFNATRNVNMLRGPQPVQALVRKPIGAGQWSADPKAVNAIISDDTILQTGLPFLGRAGFCSDYCGWHSSFYERPRGARSPLVSLKYLWVGMANKLCPGACMSKLFSSGSFSPPSLDAGIHSTISMLAHELSETACNPTFRSWHNGRGMENADYCAWKFGNVLTGAPAAAGQPPVAYNLVGEGGAKFLIQSNLDKDSGRCSLS